MATEAPTEEVACSSSASGQLPAGFEALQALDEHPLFGAARLEEVRPGRSLHVLSSPRPGSRVTLFFVHGSAATCTQWEFLLAHFSRDYAVVAFDAVGAQPSAPPPWRSLPLLAAAGTKRR